MEIKVHNRYVRISPRKARPVLHDLRGKNAEEAKNMLAFTHRKAAGFLHGLVKSGIAAAKENYLEPGEVIIKAIFCNEGPRLKRTVPWSKGQARRITKKMSHFTLILESVEDKKPKIQEKAKDKDENIKEIS